MAAVSDDALSFDDTVGTVLDQFVGRRVQVFVLLPGNPDAPGLMGAGRGVQSSKACLGAGPDGDEHIAQLRSRLTQTASSA